MSLATFHRTRIPNIGDGQWARIADFLATPKSFMPHVVGHAVGVSYTLANALIVALASDGFAKNYWLVFHACEEHPVDRRDFSQGFVATPWTCPECQREIERADELRYEIECETSAPVLID